MDRVSSEVLLVGGIDWRNEIKCRCQETTFVEVEEIPPAISEATALIVAERRELVEERLSGILAGSRRIRVLLVDGPNESAVDDGVTAVVSVDSLDDVTLGDYIRASYVGDVDAVPLGFEERVQEELLTDFHTELLDTAGYLLMGWRFSSSAKPNEPGEFDRAAFNTHLDHLKWALSHHAGPLSTRELKMDPAMAVSDVRVCLSVCERTVFLAVRGEQPPSRFGPVGETADRGEARQVLCDDWLLTALLLVIMGLVPADDLRLADITFEEETTLIVFPFPLRDPPWAHELGVEGFVDRFRRRVPEFLKPFGASIEVSDTSLELRLKLFRG